MKPKLKTILKYSTQQLNSLYRDKSVYYNDLYGKIINIAYYDNLDFIPFAELELRLPNCKTTTKIIPLSEVILVFNSKIA